MKHFHEDKMAAARRRAKVEILELLESTGAAAMADVVADRMARAELRLSSAEGLIRATLAEGEGAGSLPVLSADVVQGLARQISIDFDVSSAIEEMVRVQPHLAVLLAAFVERRSDDPEDGVLSLGFSYGVVALWRLFEAQAQANQLKRSFDASTTPPTLEV